MLVKLSYVTVVCTVSVLLYCLPQLVASGVIEPGPLFEPMVVLPTVVGIVASVIGTVAGSFALPGVVRRRQYATAAMVIGQLLTWALAAAIAYWALNFGTTGWELLVLPVALFVGQAVVAGGLIARFVKRRRVGVTSFE